MRDFCALEKPELVLEGKVFGKCVHVWRVVIDLEDVYADCCSILTTIENKQTVENAMSPRSSIEIV